MSELNIRIRKLQDNGSTFRATPETLYMGGVGSARVDTLRFEVPEEWNGCAISLHVKRLSGALPDPQLLDENHCVVVDKRWTKEKQGSWMLLAMNDAGYIAMTKPGKYTCYETIDLNSTTETITQSLYEQFVAAVLNYANQALASRNAAGEKAEEAKGHAGQAEQAKTDAQTAAQQAGESAEKAGQALSDTIAAKDDALKAIDEKQTSAEQIVDIARSRAVSQVRAAGERAKTDVRAAASEAAGSADLASQEAEQAGAAREEAERLRREILSVTTVLPFPLMTADGTTLTTADGETLDAGVRRVRGAKEAEEAAQQAKAARTEAEQAAAATQAEQQAAQRGADRAERARSTRRKPAVHERSFASPDRTCRRPADYCGRRRTGNRRQHPIGSQRPGHPDRKNTGRGRVSASIAGAAQAVPGRADTCTDPRNHHRDPRQGRGRADGAGHDLTQGGQHYEDHRLTRTERGRPCGK